MAQPIITLLTDFGAQDAYVGMMKGVIAQIAPQAAMIDLTHQIPPQDRPAARFNLMNAYPYFPAGTIHLAVVDPGVGSHRRAIALQLATGLLVGPDNGIFSGILAHHPAIRAVELTQRAYWRTPNPSHTFHGRDIFAPVAAHLANGVPLLALGAPIDLATLTDLPLPSCVATATGVRGMIQYIDQYGNGITTIAGDRLPPQPWTVQIQGRVIPGRSTYADVAPGQAVGLMGSHGWVELAINGGNAAAQLGLAVGTELDVMIAQI